jgi:sulfonate transport system substrate-binding protein
MRLTIGVHPNNLHLRIAQHWPGAFCSFGAGFFNYQEGRRTSALLEAGLIDFGGTGSTPPIIAQAAGLDVAYVAASSPRPANGAILVSYDSRIATVAGLAGRRVALLDGSFHTYLLARTLEEVNLSLRDVVRVELEPAPSQQALADGTVDAWVAMAPHLDAALEQGRAKLLVSCGSIIPNRSVFWTLRRRHFGLEVAMALAEELDRIGRAIAADPAAAARILAVPDGDARQIETWTKVVAGRDWRVVSADTAILSEQQDEADTLYRHGDLPHRIVVHADRNAVAEAP